jgi:hypothetical protein
MPFLRERRREFHRLFEVGKEDALDEFLDCRWMGSGDVEFFVDIQAEGIEVGRAEGGPTVVDRALHVRHSRIDVDADTLGHHPVGSNGVAAVDDAGVVFIGKDDAHVDAAAAGLRQLVQDGVAGKVRVLDVDPLPGVADRGDLGLL